MLQVAEAAGGWNESSILSNNAPGIGAVLGTVTLPQNPDFVVFDVTASVVKWLNTPSLNNGFAVSGVGSAVAYLESKESVTTSHPGVLSFQQAGPQGATGSNGPTGLQGIQGITGATGAQGIEGRYRRGWFNRRPRYSRRYGCNRCTGNYRRRGLNRGAGLAGKSGRDGCNRANRGTWTARPAGCCGRHGFGWFDRGYRSHWHQFSGPVYARYIQSERCSHVPGFDLHQHRWLQHIDSARSAVVAACSVGSDGGDRCGRADRLTGNYGRYGYNRS